MGAWSSASGGPGPCCRRRAPRCPVPPSPSIDAHNHLGRWLSADGGWLVPDVDALLTLMDGAGVRHVVNLDGRWGQELVDNLDRYDRAHPDRFSTFCHLDWSQLTADDDVMAVTGRLVDSLAESAAAGAKGVKVWKDLGLTVVDSERRAGRAGRRARHRRASGRW